MTASLGHGHNINTDAYVPNPCAKSGLAVSYFEFLGKMIGISTRVQLCLPFQFPAAIWKMISGGAMDVGDLESIDSIIVQFVRAVRDCEEEGVTSEGVYVCV